MRIRHVILDRDGVLDREPAVGWVADVGAWRWEDGALEALARLAAAGVQVSVVTNQSGIGRGAVEAGQVEAVHAAMRAEAARAGGRIATVHVCPHRPEDGCACRKPRPGLVLAAIAESAVPLAETLLVGDDARDLEAGRAAGIRTLLVRTGKGRVTEERLDGRIPAFDDLRSAVAWLLGPAAAGARPPAGFSARFEEHLAVVREAADALAGPLEAVLGAMVASLRGGGKLLACGNGGSAADAQHFATELVQAFARSRGALPAVALGAAVATLTAVANDVGFEHVFAREVEALGAPGDVLVAISTSGASPNVLRAAEAARARGLVTVALTGRRPCPLADRADHVLAAPSTVVARVQEVHELCLHALAEALEDALCPRQEGGA